MTSIPPAAPHEALHQPSFALDEADFEWLRGAESSRADAAAFVLRVQAWLDAELAAVGHHVDGLSTDLQFDVPSGRVRVRLGLQARGPRSGATVDLEMDAVGVQAYLVIPTAQRGGAYVDAKNFHAALADAAGAERLMKSLGDLPDVFVMGAHGKLVTVGRDPDPKRVQRAIEDAELRDLPFLLGCSFPRATVMALGEDLADALDTVLMALLPLLHQIAWSPDNDWLPAQPRSRSRSAVARARRRGPPRDAERRRSILESLALDGEPPADMAGTNESDRAPPRVALALPRPKLHSTTSTRGLRSLVSADRVDAGIPLAVGAKVRASTGAFEGKVGTVLELDEAHARVAFGPLTARCRNDELGVVVPPRTQPPLGSSHRKKSK